MKGVAGAWTGPYGGKFLSKTVDIFFRKGHNLNRVVSAESVSFPSKGILLFVISMHETTRILTEITFQ